MQDNDWVDKIKVGDILLENGRPRVVRKVDFKKNGRLGWITFSILRCSWTQRCYTMITRSDLVYRKFRPSGLRQTFSRPIDKLIAHDILYPKKKKQRLTCYSVMGIR